MVVKYELKKDAKMTPEQMQEIENAAQMPIVYDDDSPELTEEMARAFAEARVRQPYRGKKVGCPTKFGVDTAQSRIE